jgi:hypothetical protein
MSHWLPDIEIAITQQVEVFLDGMAELGRASGRFDVERIHDGAGVTGYHAVNFRLREDSVHKDLGLQLLSPPDHPNPIRVETRAQRWSPAPTTRDIYVEITRSLLEPLLTAWNQAHSTRYRLKIERFEQDRFKPTERTQELFDHFAVLANTSSLHSLDWNRFYLFVRECRQETPAHELQAMLRRWGFSEEKAEYLAKLYGHLWSFKRLR